MKFQSVKAFEYFCKSNQNVKIHLYLVLAIDSYEKKACLDKILENLTNKSDFFIEKHVANKIDVEKIIENMSATSLFGGEPLVIIDEFESFSTDSTKKLINFLKTPLNYGKLVISSSKKLGLNQLTSLFDQHGIVIDLTAEKFWDKEKRLIANLREKAKLEKKNISNEALLLMLEKVGPDMALLDQEMNKLLVFTCDKQEIRISDVEQIIIGSGQNTLWKMAENFVWDGVLDKNIHDDESIFHPLVSTIRSQLQLGLKLASFVDEGIYFEKVSKYFPGKMHSKVFNKRKEVAILRGANFYKNALISLMEIDLLSKNKAISYKALIDMLFTKINF